MDVRLRELERAAKAATGKERARLRGQLWSATLSVGAWPEFVHRSALQTAIEVAQFASWLGDLGAREFLRQSGAQATGHKIGVMHHLMLGDSVPSRCSIWCCERALPLIETLSSNTVAREALEQCMHEQLKAEAEVDARASFKGWPPLYRSARHGRLQATPEIDLLSALQELLRALGFADREHYGTAEDLMRFAETGGAHGLVFGLLGPGHEIGEVPHVRRGYAAAFALMAIIRLYMSFFRQSLSHTGASYGFIRESRPLHEPANMFLKFVLPMCDNALSISEAAPGRAWLTTGQYAWTSHGSSQGHKWAIKELKEFMRQRFVPWATSGIVPP